MKKTLLVLAVLLLFTGCGGRLFGEPSVPFRVWESWEEMLEVLGECYLFPTYLPEFTSRSANVSKMSWYNPAPRDGISDMWHFEYFVHYLGDSSDDRLFISATDLKRRDGILDDILRSLQSLGDFIIDEPLIERFNEHTISIGGVDIAFYSVYNTLLPPQWITDYDEWRAHHPQNMRRVYSTFTIDAVTYGVIWTQFNIEYKYADDEQREGLLRVATSIIEQAREIECNPIAASIILVYVE